MDPIWRKFSGLLDLSQAERGMLRRLHDDYQDIAPRTRIASPDEGPAHTWLLQYGWAMVNKQLANGSQQILSFAVPGDFLGLSGIVLGKNVHTMETITRARVCRIRWDQLLELFEGYPRLVLSLYWFKAREDILLREHLVRIGRHCAYDRTSHLFLELLIRLERAGQAAGDGFRFPVTQELLADALGLTPIHVSRTLKKLRVAGLVTLADGHLIVHDRARLARETGFEDDYLKETGFAGDIVRNLKPPAAWSPRGGARVRRAG